MAEDWQYDDLKRRIEDGVQAAEQMERLLSEQEPPPDEGRRRPEWFRGVIKGGACGVVVAGLGIWWRQYKATLTVMAVSTAATGVVAGTAIWVAPISPIHPPVGEVPADIGPRIKPVDSRTQPPTKATPNRPSPTRTPTKPTLSASPIRTVNPSATKSPRPSRSVTPPIQTPTLQLSVPPTNTGRLLPTILPSLKLPSLPIPSLTLPSLPVLPLASPRDHG